MSREKKIENYYMNLNGFAYDPFFKDNKYGIKVANLYNTEYKAKYFVVSGRLTLSESNMPRDMQLLVERDIYRNAKIIMGGLNA